MRYFTGSQCNSFLSSSMELIFFSFLLSHVLHYFERVAALKHAIGNSEKVSW